MENQPYFHTAKAMQDIRIFIEAAVAKIRGVFPYTANPGTRGAPTRGHVGGEVGACSCPVPVISLVLSKSCVRAVTGKKYVSADQRSVRRRGGCLHTEGTAGHCPSLGDSVRHGNVRRAGCIVMPATVRAAPSAGRHKPAADWKSNRELTVRQSTSRRKPSYML
jgi:hypothetical protein